MRRFLLVMIMASGLAGCSMWDVVKGVISPSQGVSVDAELTVGDKTEEVNTDVAGEKTVNTAENITYNVHEENKGPSILWVAFAFSGWLLWFVESPQALWRRFRGKKT